MKTKAKGSRSERKIRDQLLAQGYYVSKAGGSLGLWDLVAIHPGLSHPVLIQVKTNRGPRSKELADLKVFTTMFHNVDCRVVVVVDRKPDRWFHWTIEGNYHETKSEDLHESKAVGKPPDTKCHRVH